MLTFVDGTTMDAATASFPDYMRFYNITLMNPVVLVGIFLGAMMAFAFSGLAMNAVGKAAARMVDEVRRQFREIVGILEGKAEPDYACCVAISTRGAQRAMILPSLLAISTPIATGLVLGVAGVMGLLIGATSTGFVLAIFMANAGGAWDNAKKMIEAEGRKGSDAHKAAVVGDTVGDPFKDTSGPSLNILLKLISVVALVIGPSIALSAESVTAYAEQKMEVSKKVEVSMDPHEDGTVTAYVTITTDTNGQTTVEEQSFTGTVAEVKAQVDNLRDVDATIEISRKPRAENNP